MNSPSIMPRAKERVYFMCTLIPVTVVAVSIGLFSFMPKREKQIIKKHLLDLVWNSLHLISLILTFLVKIFFVVLSDVIEVLSYTRILLVKASSSLNLFICDICELVYSIEYVEIWVYFKSYSFDLWQFISRTFIAIWQCISGIGNSITLFAANQSNEANEEYLQNSFEKGREHFSNILVDLKLIINLLLKSGKILSCKLYHCCQEFLDYHVDSYNAFFFQFVVACFVALLVLVTMKKLCAEPPVDAPVSRASERALQVERHVVAHVHDEYIEDAYSDDDEEDNHIFIIHRNIGADSSRDAHQDTLINDGASGSVIHGTVSRNEISQGDIFSSDEDDLHEGDITSDAVNANNSYTAEEEI